MKMLQLTDTARGYTIYINPVHIVSFYRFNFKDIDSNTVIDMDNGDTVWHVKESPEEIMAMLEREGE